MPLLYTYSRFLSLLTLHQARSPLARTEGGGGAWAVEKLGIDLFLDIIGEMDRFFLHHKKAALMLEPIPFVK